MPSVRCLGCLSDASQAEFQVRSAGRALAYCAPHLRGDRAVCAAAVPLKQPARSQNSQRKLCVGLYGREIFPLLLHPSARCSLCLCVIRALAFRATKPTVRSPVLLLSLCYGCCLVVISSEVISSGNLIVVISRVLVSTI